MGTLGASAKEIKKMFDSSLVSKIPYKQNELDPDPIFEILYKEFEGKKCPCFARGQEPCTKFEYFHKMRRRDTWGFV